MSDRPHTPNPLEHSGGEGESSEPPLPSYDRPLDGTYWSSPTGPRRDQHLQPNQSTDDEPNEDQHRQLSIIASTNTDAPGKKSAQLPETQQLPTSLNRTKNPTVSNLQNAEFQPATAATASHIATATADVSEPEPAILPLRPTQTSLFLPAESQPATVATASHIATDTADVPELESANVSLRPTQTPLLLQAESIVSIQATPTQAMHNRPITTPTTSHLLDTPTNDQTAVGIIDLWPTTDTGTLTSTASTSGGPPALSLAPPQFNFTTNSAERKTAYSQERELIATAVPNANRFSALASIGDGEHSDSGTTTTTTTTSFGTQTNMTNDDWTANHIDTEIRRATNRLDAQLGEAVHQLTAEQRNHVQTRQTLVAQLDVLESMHMHEQPANTQATICQDCPTRQHQLDQLQDQLAQHDEMAQRNLKLEMGACNATNTRLTNQARDLQRDVEHVRKHAATEILQLQRESAAREQQQATRSDEMLEQCQGQLNQMSTAYTTAQQQYTLELEQLQRQTDTQQQTIEDLRCRLDTKQYVESTLASADDKGTPASREWTRTYVQSALAAAYQHSTTAQQQPQQQPQPTPQPKPQPQPQPQPQQRTSPQMPHQGSPMAPPTYRSPLSAVQSPLWQPATPVTPTTQSQPQPDYRAVSAAGFRPGEHRATSPIPTTRLFEHNCVGDACTDIAATFSYNNKLPYCCRCLDTFVHELAARRTPAPSSAAHATNATIQVTKFDPTNKADSIADFQDRIEEEMLNKGIGRDGYMVNRNIVFNIAPEHREPFTLGSSDFLTADWTQAWGTLRQVFRTEQPSYVEAMANLQKSKASRTEPSLAASLNKYERRFLQIEATKLDEMGYAANFDELQVQIMQGHRELIIQQTKCAELWEMLRKCIAAFVPRAILAAFGHGWNRRQCSNVADYLEFRHDAIDQWRRILDSEKPVIFAIGEAEPKQAWKRKTRQPTADQLTKPPSASGFRPCRCGLDHFKEQCKYNAAVNTGRFNDCKSDMARAETRKLLDNE
jgi:hypothetical protein